MGTKDTILELRMKKGMSQDELAEKVFVTRLAVSRWETGETAAGSLTPLCRHFLIFWENQLTFDGEGDEITIDI